MHKLVSAITCVFVTTKQTQIGTGLFGIYRYVLWYLKQQIEQTSHGRQNNRMYNSSIFVVVEAEAQNLRHHAECNSHAPPVTHINQCHIHVRIFTFPANRFWKLTRDPNGHAHKTQTRKFAEVHCTSDLKSAHSPELLHER